MNWLNKKLQQTNLYETILLALLIIGFLVSVSAAIQSIGEHDKAIKKNKQRINRLEKENAVNKNTLNNIDDKLNRVEGKIDKLIERKLNEKN